MRDSRSVRSWLRPARIFRAANEGPAGLQAAQVCDRPAKCRLNGRCHGLGLSRAGGACYRGVGKSARRAPACRSQFRWRPGAPAASAGGRGQRRSYACPAQTVGARPPASTCMLRAAPLPGDHRGA
jgi:hypothetical protein